MAGRRVAIFGGSFNPPHVAHVLGVTWVLACDEVDEVVVIPAYQHPFAKTLAPFGARLAMCELAFAWLPHVTVSRVEETLGGESRTVRTLEHLSREHPDWTMRLVIGTDVLSEVGKWIRWDRIQELAPPLVLGRVGFHVDGAPSAVLPDVSSTRIRARIAQGEWDALGSLVPKRVVDYLKEHRVYEGV
jgi:nicotinate-nucleotide adenylyltransferase